MTLTQANTYLSKKIMSCWKIFIWTFPVLLIFAVAQSFFPIVIQHLLHAVFVEKNTTAMQKSMLTIVILLVIRSTADFGGRYLIRKAGDCLYTQLSTTLFDLSLRLPTQQNKNRNKREAFACALTSIKQISTSTTLIIIILVRDTLCIAGLIACLIWLDKDFALFMAFLIPFAIIISHVIHEHRHAHMNNTNAPASSKLTSHLQHIVENFRSIWLYGGQQQESRRLKKESQQIRKNSLRQANYSAFVIAICQLIILLIIAAMTYLITEQVIRNQLILEQAFALAIAMMLLSKPLYQLATLPRLLRITRQHLQQFFLFIDQPVPEEQTQTVLSEAQGKLTFKHVSIFDPKLSDTAQFKIESLDIKPGEIVAIVCQSAPAQQQLIDLILGFEQPAAGQLLLNDVPYPEIKQADLLSHLAMVSNEPVILNDTVAGNIAYGLTECAHEASITAAVQTARASMFVREMPNGLQTRVDEHGANLTHQQWQKLQIARALLKNAPILIINDLWLQPHQASLNEALIALIQNRTAILLMQTAPMIRDYIDRIFLLDTGTVIER